MMIQMKSDEAQYIWNRKIDRDFWWLAVEYGSTGA
jgi:hypothetical protein